MPLAKQNITIPFSHGVDTKTDPKLVPAGTALALENATFTKTGALSKRNGYEKLFQTAEKNGYALATLGGALVSVDSAGLNEWSSATQQSLNKAPLASAYITQQVVARNQYQQTSQDGITHSSGLQIYVWEDSSASNRVAYSVLDSDGGFLVQNATLSTSGIKPKVIALDGGSVVCLYYDTSSHELAYSVLYVYGAHTFGSPSYITDLSGTDKQINATTPNYDACLVQAPWGPTLYVAYYTTLDNTMLLGFKSVTLLSGGTTQDYYVLISAISAACLTVFADTWDGQQAVGVASQSNSGLGAPILMSGYDTTLTMVHGSNIPVSGNLSQNVCQSITVVGGLATTQHSASVIIWTNKSTVSAIGADIQYACVTNYAGYWTDTNGWGSVGTLAYTVALAGKAWLYNGSIYIPVVFQSAQELQNTYFVVDLITGLALDVPGQFDFSTPINSYMLGVH